MSSRRADNNADAEIDSESAVASEPAIADGKVIGANEQLAARWTAEGQTKLVSRDSLVGTI